MRSSEIDKAAKQVLSHQYTNTKNVYKAAANKEHRRYVLVKFLSYSEQLVNTTGEEFTVSEEARSIGIVNNEETSAAVQLMNRSKKMVGTTLDTGKNTNRKKKHTTIEVTSTLASATPEKNPRSK